MPSGRKTAIDFVDIVYKEALFSFYFLYDHPNDMILIEDGVPVLYFKSEDKLMACQN